MGGAQRGGAAGHEPNYSAFSLALLQTTNWGSHSQGIYNPVRLIGFLFPQKLTLPPQHMSSS